MPKKMQDSILFQFFNEVGIIEQLARAKIESKLPDGLKMSHFVVLNHLARLGGQWSPVQLANAFQVTKAAITNTLTRLDALGHVKIVPNPSDGRGKLVNLTDEGCRIRRQCIDNVEPFLKQLESEFGKDYFVSVLPKLVNIRKHLDENR